MSEHDRTGGAGQTRGYLRRGGRLVRDHGLWLTAVLSVGVFLALFLLGDASRVARAIAEVEIGRAHV